MSNIIRSSFLDGEMSGGSGECKQQHKPRNSNSRKIEGVAIIGGGLAGCLLACFLKRRGKYHVEVFESRPDMRMNLGLAGRSINLVLTSRGLEALAHVDLLEDILKLCVPVHGRTLHLESGEIAYQAYGPDSTYCNYSISRAELNVELIKAAVKMGVVFHFEEPVLTMNLEKGEFITQSRSSTGHPMEKHYAAWHIFGTDGAGSRCRQSLKRTLGDEVQDEAIPLGASYKELLMPRNPETNQSWFSTTSLHIWPRGSHFLMGLPNRDGTMTMTLYLPDHSDKPEQPCFSKINTPETIRAYFKKYYPDAYVALPDLVEQWHTHPVGFLGTVKCNRWVYEDKLCILGDAAHAITPFFGQGCNAAFESVRLLDKCLSQFSDTKDAFEAFQTLRKPDTDAIAAMAVENYTEMMSKTSSPHFLLQKELEVYLAHEYPEAYLSRYALVTHTLVPYSTCVEIGKTQGEILDELCPLQMKSLKELNKARAKELIETKLIPRLKELGIVPKVDFRDVSRELLMVANSNIQKQKSQL